MAYLSALALDTFSASLAISRDFLLRTGAPVPDFFILFAALRTSRLCYRRLRSIL